MAAACADVQLVYPVGDDWTLTGDDVDDYVDDGPLVGAARVGDRMSLPGTVGGEDGKPPVGRDGWSCGVRLGQGDYLGFFNRWLRNGAYAAMRLRSRFTDDGD